MVKTLDIVEFAAIMNHPDTMRGQFMARLSPDDWVGLDNSDGMPMIFRGSFRDVIETFVPFSGEMHDVNPIIDGVIYDRESGVRRVPMTEKRFNQARNGLARTALR